MKTLQELRQLGLSKVSLKSSKARKLLTDEEIIEIRNDPVFFELFSLMNSKTTQIVNCLRTGRDFFFAGRKIDISKLSFLA